MTTDGKWIHCNWPQPLPTDMQLHVAAGHAADLDRVANEQALCVHNAQCNCDDCRQARREFGLPDIIVCVCREDNPADVDEAYGPGTYARMFGTPDETCPRCGSAEQCLCDTDEAELGALEQLQPEPHPTTCECKLTGDDCA